MSIISEVFHNAATTEGKVVSWHLFEISNTISISNWLKTQDIVKTPRRVFGNELVKKEM